MTYKIKTFAKINLTLQVFAPRPDGYHPLCSIFQNISLHDTLTIKILAKQQRFQLTCNQPDLPVDQNNILTRLYQKLAQQLPFSLSIHLEKRIPLGAGLGGGSSNAAGLLHFLNQAAGWHYPLSKLNQLGRQFGADVPFFLHGGTALVRGIGEKVHPIPPVGSAYFVLICPDFGVSTPAAYRAFDQAETIKKQPTRTPKSMRRQHLGPNDLQAPVFQLYPKLAEITLAIQQSGAPKVYMTGSGSTLFLACPQKKIAAYWQQKIQALYPQFLILAVRRESTGFSGGCGAKGLVRNASKD